MIADIFALVKVTRFIKLHEEIWRDEGREIKKFKKFLLYKTDRIPLQVVSDCCPCKKTISDLSSSDSGKSKHPDEAARC